MTEQHRDPHDAPRLWSVPRPVEPDEREGLEPVSLVKATGAEVAVPDNEEIEPLDDEDVLEGEVVRWRQPLPARRVLPVWVMDPYERREAAKWATAYAKHNALYYGVRTPLYALRLGLYGPRGGYRVTRLWAGWVFDVEGRPLRLGSVQRGDVGDYVDLTHIRNDRVKLRLMVSGGAAGAAVVAAATATVFVPVIPWALLVVLLTVLGYFGRPLDRVFIERAVITSDVAPKLTPSMVVRALGALGIAEINKAIKDADGDGITFAGDPVRDGPGWRADVDLPFGVIARDIIAKKDRLASGLRRPISCVWPEADPDEHAGRLVLWVGDKPLRKLQMPMWPLLRDGKADIFRPLPFGVDQRGRPFNLTLIFENLLVGAMPRQGKTFSVRVLLLAAALDPIVQLRVHELKGTGDLAPLRKVAHVYASGIIDPAVESALQSLRDIDRELARRTELIKQIAAKYPLLCPENKVTRAIVEDSRWDLDPILQVIDEAQNLFSHPEFGEEAAGLAERIIKIGPALGIMLILATQKPNSKSLPTGVRSQMSLRMALRVADQDTNDMILGTGKYKTGISAMQFSRKDLGIGLLLGETDEPQIVRTFYIDNPAADRITDRALQLRQEAGTLTGVAAGELAAIEPAEGLPEHLAAVWPAGESAVWLDVLLPRIAEDHPELYGEWTTVDLGHACRSARIDRRDVGRGSKKNQKTARGIDLKVLQGVVDSRKKPL
ncbi:MAG: cell division protein FtsK/SpoIIIE [Actinomycetia bacterium]|nr:cell division protein FtsK/SpoIIIE [Actinomycetes bacterium]